MRLVCGPSSHRRRSVRSTVFWAAVSALFLCPRALICRTECCCGGGSAHASSPRTRTLAHKKNTAAAAATAQAPFENRPRAAFASNAACVPHSLSPHLSRRPLSHSHSLSLSLLPVSSCFFLCVHMRAAHTDTHTHTRTKSHCAAASDDDDDAGVFGTTKADSKMSRRQQNESPTR